MSEKSALLTLNASAFPVNLTARGSQLGGRLLSPYSPTLSEWPTVRTQRKRRGLTGTGSPLGDSKESIGARIIVPSSRVLPGRKLKNRIELRTA
jgi:hypothetical protein